MLGTCLAIEFAKQGCTLVLLDVQKKPLDDLKHELKTIFGQERVKVHTYKFDLSDLTNLKIQLATIKREVGQITVLVNNAATACFKDILAHTDDEFKQTFNVNTLAPMMITRDLLSDMIKHNHGHIINITASSGISGNAYASSYSASKAALINFTESITQELLLGKVDGVHATTVIPFYMDGGVYNHLRKFGKDIVLGVPPLRFELAGRQIMCGLQNRQSPIMLPTFHIRMTYILQSILPDQIWQRFLLHILGRLPIKYNQDYSLLNSQK